MPHFIAIHPVVRNLPENHVKSTHNGPWSNRQGIAQVDGNHPRRVIMGCSKKVFQPGRLSQTDWLTVISIHAAKSLAWQKKKKVCEPQAITHFWQYKPHWCAHIANCLEQLWSHVPSESQQHLVITKGMCVHSQDICPAPDRLLPICLFSSVIPVIALSLLISFTMFTHTRALSKHTWLPSARQMDVMQL